MKRFGFSGLALGLAALGFGQGSSLLGLGEAIGRLPGTQEPARPASGVQPADPRPLTDQDAPLPTPQSGADNQVRIIRADSIQQTNNRLVLRGNVHVLFRGYDLYADEIIGDPQTRIFTLTDRATLVGADAIVNAQNITVDFRTERYRAGQGRTQLKPRFLQGRARDDVYIRATESFGTEREVIAHQGEFTTCNLDEPHFHIESRNATIRPGRRVILRGAAIEILGRVLFRIPYLSIPLDNRRERYTPEVGQSRDEGYYIKTRWGIPSGLGSDFDAYVDYFTKLGAGLGGRYAYSTRSLDGFLRVYGLSGNTNTLDITSNHVQDIGRSTLRLENSYQRQNYLNAPQNTILNTRGTWDFGARGASNTRLTFSRNSNEAPQFSNVQQTVGLLDNRNFGRDNRTTSDVRWSKSDSTSGSNTQTREQVDVRLRSQQDLRTMQAEIEYSRTIPVGDVGNFFSAGDRTPVLTLRTDSRRLESGGFRLGLPVTGELSLGEFSNPGTRGRVTRTVFDLGVNQPDRPQRRLGFTFNSRFRQGIYSDDTAQYTVNLNSALRYRLGPDTSLNVRYNYSRLTGFAPLAIDRVGSTNQISADVSVRPLRTLLLGAQTGYDFRREEESEIAWQQLGIRAEWRPTTQFLLRGLTTYDPFLGAWSNVRTDLAYARGETYLGIGARYDGTRSIWGNVNVFLDGLRWGRARLSTVQVYNGFLKKFEAQHYFVSYDLHCAEAILQVQENNVGFRPGREIFFMIRLKAFPTETNFGIGRRGQPLGIGTGRDF